MTETVSLEDIRYTLEQSRNHIQDKWLQGEWFGVDVLIDGEVVRDCSGEYVPGAQEVTDNFKFGSNIYDDLQPEAVEVKVVGVCALGGVLHALNYTSEECIHYEKSMAVVRELFKHLPEEYKLHLGCGDQPCNCVVNAKKGQPLIEYGDMVTAVVNWNDEDRRTKEQVLELFDNTIKSVIDRM